MKFHSRRQIAILFILNAASLLALSLILFRRQAPVTFFRYDGTFILSVVKNQAEWMPTFGAFTMDFLKGMGGLWFPVDTRLMPGFLVGGLAGYASDWFPAISMTWFAFEFAIAVILIARVLAIQLPAAVMAVWFGLLGALPYFVPAPAMERTWGNPHLLSFIALSTIVLVLFIEIGRSARDRTIACVFAIVLILGYLTVVAPLTAILFLPVLGFFGAVSLTMTADQRELRVKLIAGGLLSLQYLLFFAAWLPGLFLYAKTTFFWSDMYPTPVNWESASLLLENPLLRPAGVLLYCVALFGGLITAWQANGMQRRFAIGYLCFVALLWICTGLMAVIGGDWSGPPISYLDWMIYPLHSLFAAQCVYLIILKLSSSILVRRAITPAFLLASAVLPWTALAVWAPPYQRPFLKNQIPFGWPPLRTSFVDFLQGQIGLQPGSPFRGRVVNLAGASFEAQYANAPFISQHDYDGMVAFMLGNDHREYGFWAYDIPTLDDTNHIQSPFFHLLMSRLLNPKGVLFFRPHETATLLKPKILSQLGVRYVLTEEPLAGRTLVREIEMAPTRKQYLYELEDPNVAGRAVTRVTIARTAAQALAWTRAEGMDFRHEAVLFDPLPNLPLVPVSRSRLEVYPGYLRLSAQAPGRALLVLPVEFSRCLEFTPIDVNSKEPIALRANLDQAAILFDNWLDVRIALRNDPFTNPICRFRDFQDAVRLQLGQAR